ncbi:MAG TPA: calcium-binding protein [Actinomycetota bacterium]|nr:calcium-binding protein [Actinomycetota bacterium]
MATILTTAGALLGFQALAVIGAVPASAVTSCTYNPATDTINITIDPNGAAYVAVESADDLDAESPVGAILFTPSGVFPPNFDPDTNSAQCGSATVSNTTQIVVLGSPSGAEFFGIDEQTAVGGEPGTFPSTISWAVDLGGAAGDEFEIDLDDDTDNNVVLTDTSFSLNGGTGELVGVELIQIFGEAGDDTLDASAVSANVEADLFGGAGDDWIAPGAFDGDAVSGDADSDTLSYGTRTTSVAVVNGVDAGLDANGDGDNDDVGDEEDLIDCFETVVTGSGNDTIDDAACGDSTYVPGDGDDDITGDATDVLDWSTSSAAMTIDPANGTATGQGTDTFTGITSFIGSAFDDVLLWDGTTTFFSGGDGTDTVDASATTTSNVIDLDTLDGTPVTGVGAPVDDLENAIGGSANDTLTGNDRQNRLEGRDGDDALVGAAGNDLLLGGNGNDTYTGGAGADTVSFASSPNGVEVDMNLGFATGEGDDGFGDTIETVVGSDHDDSITGGGGVVAINFRFIGRAGDDLLTGSGSNDTLRGGGGSDVLRGVNGDDNLRGGKGNDRLFGGSGVDVGNGGKGKDVCKGVEIKSSCGTKKSPKAPVTRQRL